MGHNGPTISVIIPSHNRAAYLATAVETVRQQRHPSVEIIVVDDGSSDDTARLVRSLGPNLRYLYQSNQGPAAARNRGLAAAEGKFVAFLDADDAWPRGRLQTMLGHLEQDRLLHFVLGLIQSQERRASAGGFQFRSTGKPFLLWSLGAALFRRSAFDRVGPLDATLRFSEDLDWYLKAMELGLPIRVIPKIALYYRMHDANMTRDRQAVGSSIMQALKRSLDRRRQSETRLAAPLAMFPGVPDASQRME